MKKIIFLAACVLIAYTGSSQLGKNLESKLNGTATDPLNEYPKGMTAYSKTHTDSLGISGTYYLRFPVQFMYKNAMNACKTFTVDQLVIEFDPTTFTGRIHVVDNAIENTVRIAGYQLENMYDLYASGLKDVQKNVCRLFNFVAIEVNCKNYTFGSIMGASKNGAFRSGMMYRSVDDSDVLVFGSVYAKENRVNYDDNFSYGGNLNALSKDQSKLVNWDSTKIVTELFRHQKLNEDYVSKSLGELVALPKLALDDDTREAEYFEIISGMAAQDKPVAWADKFVYCYINTDWKDEYKGNVKTHRWCTVIAVSTGWTEGSEGRYIPAIMKQNWDGSTYGKTYMAGFQGALVPVSQETIMSFKH